MSALDRTALWTVCLLLLALLLVAWSKGCASRLDPQMACGLDNGLNRRTAPPAKAVSSAAPTVPPSRIGADRGLQSGGGIYLLKGRGP
jgi:hypothetical protein